MNVFESALQPAFEVATDRTLIQLRNVSRIYMMGATKVAALQSINLEIPEHQFVAVVGRSGCGKSTLLQLLAGMEKPTAGEVNVGNWCLMKLSRKHSALYRRQMIGMVFQSFNLIPSMTALANVELPLMLAGVPPRQRLRRARQCLELVGLKHRMDHRPIELSGGEQQRVAIARALCPDPPILLADEPTGNLDSTTAEEVMAILTEVQREHGKTVVIVTHNMQEIEGIAERVIQMHDGRILQNFS